MTSGKPHHKCQLKPRPGVPFSRPIEVEAVPESGLELDIEATETERAAVAGASGLAAVGALRATYKIARRGQRRFDVAGALTARITQACVVTLEPFDAEIAQAIDVSFESPPEPVPERSRRRQQPAADVRKVAPPPTVVFDDVDAPDPIVDGIIDLGALAVEFLMLARDMYPRKPGVAFADITVGEGAEQEPSAFAVLKRLKDPT